MVVVRVTALAHQVGCSTATVLRNAARCNRAWSNAWYACTRNLPREAHAAACRGSHPPTVYQHTAFTSSMTQHFAPYGHGARRVAAHTGRCSNPSLRRLAPRHDTIKVTSIK